MSIFPLPPSDGRQLATKPNHVLLEMLDPFAMTDEEQAAVWTLLLFLRRRELAENATADAQSVPEGEAA